MKKEDFITTFVMLAVCTMMLVGVTIAWYTAVHDKPTVTSMEMEAEETGDIKIALEQGGDDIEDLKMNDIVGDEYVVIGLEKLTNIEDGKMAPGAFGEVKFWVTPLKKDVTRCLIVPSVVLNLEMDDGSGESDDGESDSGNGESNDGDVVLDDGNEESDSGNANDDENSEIENLVNKHIAFYTDEAMTEKNRITESEPAGYDLGWNDTENTGVELEITIYWQWYYEYPFNQAGDDALSASDREEKIRKYDIEDTQIGTEVEKMNFHFVFKSQ